VVDISNLQELEKTAEQLKKEHGNIDVLINNAGIVVGKYFHEHSATEIEKNFSINSSAPIHICNQFLKNMMEENSGHICNIASSAGLVANPKMSVYAASKWAIFAWSDSLRLEMKQLQKNIQVTTILPYYINTGMFDSVQSRIHILDAEATALTIIKAIEKNKKSLAFLGEFIVLLVLGRPLCRWMCLTGLQEVLWEFTKPWMILKDVNN